MSISTGAFKSLSLTRALGTMPGGGEVIFPGDESGSYTVGAGVVVNVGSAPFYGVITGVRTEEDRLEGTITRVSIADNRIRMQWDPIKFAANFTELREDNPETPGIDRQRRFWTIKPDDHAMQVKTWTAAPYTAKQIINWIRADLGVAWAFTVSDPDDLLNAPVYEIDANNGATVASVIGTICDQLGIFCTLTGENQLGFFRKGVGSLPSLSSSVKAATADGEALSHVPLHMEVVGGRNEYQVCQIDLEPWWVSHYEQYVSESAWLDKVEELWGTEWAGATTALEKNARRAVKAREATLREYVTALVVSGADYEDRSMWGEVSRMEMPVWRYVRDIVFKAYRVPRDFVITIGTGEDAKDIGIDSLELQEGLLAAVDYDDSGNINLRTTPARQWYPYMNALVIVQGQQVRLVDPRGLHFVSPEMLGSLRTVWTASGGFALDGRPAPEGIGIIFEDQVFMDTAEHPLFLYPNRGAAGITSAHPLYNLCVPNADVATTAANVRAALTFRGDKFLQTFGDGARWGTIHNDAIAKHLIVQEGVVTDEVPWPDGSEAADQAEAFVSQYIGQQVTYQDGKIVRVGGAGTLPNGMVDRVTVTVDFNGGTREEIDFTKERPPVNYFPERLLERQARQHDLYKGQRALREEVFELRGMAAVSANKPNRPGAVHADIPALLGAVVGNPDAGIVMEKLPADKEAGEPIWKIASTGAIDDAGTVLAGIVVQANAPEGWGPLATQGVVPVRVQGPFAAGSKVGVNEGDSEAVPDGKRIVGTVQATYSGTEVVLAPVALCDAAAATEMREFDVAPFGPGKVMVMSGPIMGKVPSGATAGRYGHWEISVPGNGVIYAMVRRGADGSFSDHAVLHGTTVPSYVFGSATNGGGYGPDGSGGFYYYWQLAAVTRDGGANVTAVQTRSGPIERLPATHTSTYALESSDSETPHQDYWLHGTPYVSGSPVGGSYDSVSYRESRVWVSEPTSVTFTDSNGDTTTFQMRTRKRFRRLVKVNSSYGTWFVGPETLEKTEEYLSYASGGGGGTGSHPTGFTLTPP